MPTPAAEPVLDPETGEPIVDPIVDPNASPEADPEPEPTGAQPEDELKALQVKFDASQVDLAKAKKESGEWMTRFTGMQGKYQQEKKKWDDASGDLSGLPTQLSDLQTKLDVSETSNADLQTQLLSTTALKETADAALERKNIIFKEFPGLIGFEGDGLLPEGVGEDLRTKLTAFNEKMVKIGGDNFETVVAGSSVEKPKAKEEDNKTALAEQIAAFQSGDMTAYEGAYGKILNSQDNSKE